MSSSYVVGVDFGTLSGRVVVVDAADGRELAVAEHRYPHGVLDEALPDGTPLGPEWALQVPADYREVLAVAVPEAVRSAGIDPAEVVGNSSQMFLPTRSQTSRPSCRAAATLR